MNLNRHGAAERATDRDSFCGRLTDPVHTHIHAYSAPAIGIR
jgi:hypothetical protein